MAKEFIPLNDNDTKELRKELGLPVTKQLVYWRKENLDWLSYPVSNYVVCDTYMPSNTHSLLITLESGEEIRILADFFADMQKTTFISDYEGNRD
jgi:hypothetical protein